MTVARAVECATPAIVHLKHVHMSGVKTGLASFYMKQEHTAAARCIQATRVHTTNMVFTDGGCRMEAAHQARQQSWTSDEQPSYQHQIL